MRRSRQAGQGKLVLEKDKEVSHNEGKKTNEPILHAPCVLPPAEAEKMQSSRVQRTSILGK